MAEVQKYSLIDKLKEADETLKGSPTLLGMSMLTWPNYNNSMRTTMFTAHARQAVTLVEPDFPYVFTNNENIVGKYSTGYYNANTDLEIVKKITKFADLNCEKMIYVFIVYNKKIDKYDIIERRPVKSLTENFGYEFINDVIDGYSEGDTIEKGTTLYRSTSYDNDMNYGYGRNITIAYTLEPFTSEDAAIASRSLQKKLTSIETDVIPIKINSNDYLLNLYGDKHHYKPLPDIGTKVSRTIAASRRLFKNQLLHDFRNSNLTKISDEDTEYMCDTDCKIIDYVIYDNNDERQENSFYNQIYMYKDAQDKYYQEIYDFCSYLKQTGKKTTPELDYMFKRADEFLDEQKKWKDGNNISSNIRIDVEILRRAELAKGSKITGRYGNKSVIADIWEDDQMPYTKDGRRADLLLNLLAIINRTTAFPLYELFITGSAYQVRQHMKTMKTYKEKEHELFNFIRVLNEDQADEFYQDYLKLDSDAKKKYIDDAIEDGIYIHQTPLWEKLPIFYRCQNLRRAFPYIKLDDVYIKKWGREYKVLTKYFIGEMYIMKLKQSDRRGFSARSTGALDLKSIPTRSFKSKNHTERTSSSCIRFGIDETLNFLTGLSPEDVALFHAMYRSSIKGRHDIGTLMFEDENAIQKIDKSYTSRIAEIFDVILKSLGIELVFENDDDVLKPYDNNVIGEHVLNGKTVLCTEYQFYLMQRYDELRKEVLEANPVITTDNLNKAIDKLIKSRAYIIGDLDENMDGFEDFIHDEAIIEEIRQSIEDERERYRLECESKSHTIEDEISLAESMGE